MTSRTSFSKITKEDRKHRLGVNLVLAMYFVIVIFVMAIQVQGAITNKTDVDKVILQFLVPNGFLILAVVMLAILFGVNNFSYLHSRQKEDLYHSLPITRKELYRVITLNSLQIFGIMQAVTLLLQWIAAMIFGYGSFDLLLQAGVTWACYILIFQTSYLLTAIAMMLTGNTAVGVMGTIVFMSWIPVVWNGALSGLCGTFFSTYAQDPGWFDYLQYASPEFTAYGLAQGFDGTWIASSASISFFVLLIWRIVLDFAAGKLFVIRPSEVAGTAMAFPKWNTFFKFYIGVPLGLLWGNIFGTILVPAQAYKMGTIIATIFSCIAAVALIESIYTMDARAAFSKKKEMTGVVVAALLIVGTFALDIYGFDRYTPEKDSISSVMLEESSMYLFFDDSDETWEDGLRGISGEEKDKAIEILSNVKIGQEPEDVHIVDITYYLNSGKKKVRSYRLEKEEYRTLKSVFMDSEDFKKEIYSVYRVKKERITKLDFYSKNENTRMISLKSSLKNEFLEIYKEEFSELTYEEMMHVVPVAKFNMTYQDGETWDDGENFRTTDEYYIYSSFEKTIAFLEEQGCDVEAPDLSNVAIKKITIEQQNGKKKVVTSQELLSQVSDKLYAWSLLPEEYIENTGSEQDDSIEMLEAVVDYGNGDSEIVDIVTDTETLELLLR